jgi:hypothetical protein
MNGKDYTNILLENQKDYLESQNRLIEVLTRMEGTLETMNDTNILHVGKEDARYDSIDRLVSAVEARAKVMNTIFTLFAAAIVILAGAEKALQFLKL